MKSELINTQENRKDYIGRASCSVQLKDLGHQSDTMMTIDYRHGMNSVHVPVRHVSRIEQTSNKGRPFLSSVSGRR
ncbi:hypothetical protein RRG08_062200 [Elysia crispata]|uniref:Uncharacterized protein n=1 Tax=Elysia crispata TaxID=231223 RepID=A0AAE1CUL0_9GAST|nr:hypothetical protein RRG08_062200 [Elysia crispata]